MAMLALAISFTAPAQAATPKADEVLEITKKVADWQLETFEDQATYRALRTDQLKRSAHKYHELQWQSGALYAGIYQLTEIVNDKKYVNWLYELGDRNEWSLHDRLFHADDHAVGQFYLSMYRRFNEPKMLRPTMERFNEIMASPEADDFHWWWCDALFMAPPVWTRLARITGNNDYLEYMDTQYHKTYDKLWCDEDQLFFRDANYFTKYEKNGKHIYWSRGNGWVFGGLALLIPDLPKMWDGREFYIDLFKTMAQTLKRIQREDGTWSAGLLGSVDDYQTIETSGTSFFVFGLAWGLNNGYLDKATYEPVLFKAWETLCNDAVHENGMLGYVQGVAGSPGGSTYEGSEIYGTGAFVAAGAEIYKYLTK